MTPKPSRPQVDRSGPARRRAALMVVPVLISWVLAGCGDPDDGGGGGGYITSQQVVPAGQ